jgi:hypothetical protein
MESMGPLAIIDLQTMFLTNPPMCTVDADDLVCMCQRWLRHARRDRTPVLFVQRVDEGAIPVEPPTA